MSAPNELYVCWTTVSSPSEAESLARHLVDRRLAVCVQVDGPIRSFYRWQGETQDEQEARVWIKCVAAALPSVEEAVRAQHPYDTPQWVCIQADKVGEKYLKWAGEVSTLRGFL